MFYVVQLSHKSPSFCTLCSTVGGRTSTSTACAHSYFLEAVFATHFLFVPSTVRCTLTAKYGEVFFCLVYKFEYIMYGLLYCKMREAAYWT